MLKNYLTTAIRNLASHKLYSTINIVGLATGLTCCILILLFVRDELSYDTWLADAERIYRVDVTFNVPGRGPMLSPQAPGPFKAALEKDFPDQIEHVVRILVRRPTFELGDRQFNDQLAEVDGDFFEVFDLTFVEGDKSTALQDTKSLIMTQTMARKYFGDQSALGRTITVTRERAEDYKVAGVIEDLPDNSHLEFQFLSLFDPGYYVDMPWVTEQWTSTNTYIYVKAGSPADAAEIMTRMKSFTDANVVFEIPGVDHITPSDIISFNLQPVPDIHLYSEVPGGMKEGGDIIAVYTFSAVAALILLIASINFMNLATARSMQRAREVSMRKVMGASRSNLILQFLGESVIMTLVALVLALAAVKYTLPFYNDFIGKTLSFGYLAQTDLILWLIGVAVLVGCVGGIYPALILSRFRPARVLKANQSSSSEGTSRMRVAMVIIQFSISIGLIASTALIYSQTYYAKNLDMGFNKDNKLIISGLARDTVEPLRRAIEQQIAALPGVRSLAHSSDAPPQRNSNNTLVDLPNAPSDDLNVIETITVGYNFFPTLGVEPLAGRLFSIDHPGDVTPADMDEVEGEVSIGVLINERAVKQLGFASPEAIVGQVFKVFVGRDEKVDATVVGVLRDMNFRSIRAEITPMIFFLGDDTENFNFLTVDIDPRDMAATLRAIDRIWTDVVPDVPINRSFVDEDFAALYQAEDQRMMMFGGFAILAILIACLGLFGLASFTADRRTKEIGIRKVMGASVPGIIRLLVWQFSKPVLLANLIAWPVTYYFVGQWLQNFEYRIDIGVLPFALAGTAALLIAWATVASHAARVARSNPINALRYE